jgi:hypothetical protein
LGDRNEGQVKSVFEKIFPQYPPSSQTSDMQAATNEGYSHVCILLSLLNMVTFELKPLSSIDVTDDFKENYPATILGFVYFCIFGILTRPQGEVCMCL